MWGVGACWGLRVFRYAVAMAKSLLALQQRERQEVGVSLTGLASTAADGAACAVCAAPHGVPTTPAMGVDNSENSEKSSGSGRRSKSGDVPGLAACARCGKVVYCSKTHQVLHWKLVHKAECGV